MQLTAGAARAAGRAGACVLFTRTLGMGRKNHGGSEMIGSQRSGYLLNAILVCSVACGMVLLCSLRAIGFEQATAQTAPPAAPIAHFHHLHLNVTDPAAAINFYTSKFDSEKGRFAGLMD